MRGQVGVGEEIGEVVVRLVSSIKRRRASSSCNLWLLARFVRCCKAKGGLNTRSVRCRTQEQATNVRPEENSFLPMPTTCTTLSSVSPWALWMVTAQASFRGSCSREHWAPDDDHVWRIGVMELFYISGRVGPA